MWRACVTTKDGKAKGENFNTKEEADLWVLEQAEEGIKKAIIVNKKDIKQREIINF